MTLHDAKCAARHITDWAVEPEWFANAVHLIKAGVWPAKQTSDGEYAPNRSTMQVTQSGVAIIALEGALMKADSKYGGTSTVYFRKQLREAVAHNAIKSIVLHIDSPGGTVAGTGDAAAEVARANASKPVYAHIDDLGASAAYWIASQARAVYANATALVGSIGTYSVIYDASKNAELQGIKVHVISTGDYKGAGVPGSQVTDAHLQYAQARVDSLNQHFLAGVAKGRGMVGKDVKAVADGRVWIAKEAQGMGLIDGVQDFDKTVQIAAKAVKNIRHTKSAMVRSELANLQE